MTDRNLSDAVPELGQALFGQPMLDLECPDFVQGTVRAMADLWYDLRGDGPDNYNPFSNTGARWKNNLFTVHAYSWDEEKGQPFNLAWGDLRVGWYKYAGRGMSINRPTTKAEIRQMLKDYIATIESFTPDE